MISQGQVGSFNERSIDGIAYFRCFYGLGLVNKFRVTEDNIALDIYNFAIFSRFMNGGILQFRINHQSWLFGTAPFTSLWLTLQMAKVLYQGRLIMRQFIGSEKRF